MSEPSEPSKPAGFTNPFDWLRRKKGNQKAQPQPQAQPQVTPTPPTPPAAEAPTAPAATAIETRFHTVQAGDTLWAIAERFYGDGRQYTKIAAANSLANPDHIEPGLELKIPA